MAKKCKCLRCKGNTSFFAVYEEPYVIWGMGTSKKKAWQETEDNVRYSGRCFKCTRPRLKCAPMSGDLFSYVEASGGDFEHRAIREEKASFELHDGVLMLLQGGVYK